MMRPKIVFRVNASTAIGTGHLLECLWFAKAALKFKKVFCVNDDTSAIQLVKHFGFPVHIITRNKRNNEGAQLNAVIEKEKPDVLLFDIVDINQRSLEAINAQGAKIVVLNALFHPVRADAHAVTVFTPHIQNTQNFGTQCVLLKPAMRAFKAKMPAKTVKNILVMCGGGDAGNFTLKSLAALSRIEGDFGVTVIMGSANKNLRTISKYLKHFSNPHRLYYAIHNEKKLIRLMRNADLALASGGYTVSELMYLGIPTIGLAQNKIEHERIFPIFPHGSFINLGLGRKINEDRLSKIIAQVIDNYPRRFALSTRAARAVDGKGIARLEKLVTDSAKTRILVFGASGNLGRVVVPHLSKKFNIMPLSHAQADIGNPRELKKIISRGDIILNLAGTSTDVKDLKPHMKNNVSAQQKFLHACAHAGVKRIIFLSSLSVYTPLSRPSRETDPRTASNSYTRTKILAENMYATYSRTYHLPVTILRLGSVYGPGAAKGILSDFLRTATREHTIVIPHNPLSRDFLYIDDLISLLEKILWYNGTRFAIFNGASGTKTSLRSVALKVKKYFKKPIRISAKNPPSRPLSTWGDPAKAKLVLGFTAHTTLDQGLKKYLSH